MAFNDIFKPATVTSLGFLIIAYTAIFNSPPSVEKIGWSLVAIGTIWFFFKK